MSEFTHLDDKGQARMVDVGHKVSTHRVARASALIHLNPATLQAIRDNNIVKGDVFQVARLAGIMAAKQTSSLIPLCHPLALDSVDVEFKIENGSIRVNGTVSIHGKTGVEMEALTTVTVAALTIYDMCKSMDREIRMTDIQLDEKSGGKSGHFVRKEQD